MQNKINKSKWPIPNKKIHIKLNFCIRINDAILIKTYSQSIQCVQKFLFKVKGCENLLQESYYELYRSSNCLGKCLKIYFFLPVIGNQPII